MMDTYEKNKKEIDIVTVGWVERLRQLWKHTKTPLKPPIHNPTCANTNNKPNKNCVQVCVQNWRLSNDFDARQGLIIIFSHLRPKITILNHGNGLVFAKGGGFPDLG